VFFGTDDFSAENIEAFKLMRNPYRKAATERVFHALSFRLRGQAKYEDGNNNFITKTGDILFAPAYVKYVKDTEAELFYVIHFRSSQDLGNQLLHMTPENPEEFRVLFDKIYRVQTEKGTAYIYETKQLFYQLVALIEREYAPKDSSRAEHEMYKAIKLIHERFTDSDFSVSVLADYLCMSETYFRRQFHKIKGVSPKKYLLELRLQLAKELLYSGYYSVSEVADRCGFSNVYYFSAFFKRSTGKAPRDYICGTVEDCVEK